MVNVFFIIVPQMAVICIQEKGGDREGLPTFSIGHSSATTWWILFKFGTYMD